MSGTGADCRNARLHIGADPQHLPPEIAAHLSGCAECRRFRDETLALDVRVQAALELPLERFRSKPMPVRRFALAASALLALLLAGGVWVLRPATALARDVVTHVEEEADSWGASQRLQPEAIAGILRTAGAHFDTSLPVVYGYPCPFRGRPIAHLVVKTANGPRTIMLLPHDHVRWRKKFSQDGLKGVLLPAGRGSIAVLSRDGVVPDALADEIVSHVRFE
jgi:hypothetical protein